jgi:hypothetical protein
VRDGIVEKDDFQWNGIIKLIIITDLQERGNTETLITKTMFCVQRAVKLSTRQAILQQRGINKRNIHHLQKISSSVSTTTFFHPKTNSITLSKLSQRRLPSSFILPIVSHDKHYFLYRYHAYSAQSFINKESEEKEENGKPKKKESKIKLLYNKYGRVAIGTYISVYIGSLFTIFGLFDSGVMLMSDLPFDLDINRDGKVDMGDVNSMYQLVITYFKLDDYIDPETLSPRQGNFLLAWLTTKLTEPLRALVTIVVTPPIARRLYPERFGNDDK